MATKKAADLKGQRKSQSDKAISAADSFIGKDNDNNEELKKKKKPVSFFIAPDLYDKVQSLAQFRAAQGNRNEQGQLYSAGTLMNEAIEEYLRLHADELEAWEQIREKLHL